MIRYPISEADLWARIHAHQPNWRQRAQTRTDRFIQAGAYSEPSAIWSEIKPVYMELQHAKCGYCERWLAHTDLGSIEHDVEHFRPKSNVRTYPPTSSDPASRNELNYDFSTGSDWSTGYYRLAYHPLNYLTACKTCNTILKSDYFPVAAPRIDGATHPRDLRDERPFLLYPIGDLDAAPETLIGFDGILAVPLSQAPAERRRAQVTIDFFQLNNREDLRRERAAVISALHLALLTRENAHPLVKKEATRCINAQMHLSASHANCSRCFVRLYQTNPNRASDLAEEAAQLRPA